MNKAILFLIFNRLDTTKMVFEQIRAAKPPRLYLASDGARLDRENEDNLVNEVRDWVLANVDWECEIKTLFRTKNLGCGKAISSAVSWFFGQEEDGIILEDDCVPNQSFFKYCEILLDQYASNKEIWHISGNNPLGCLDNPESYYFAKIAQCWGWATWADRWKHFNYDFNLSDFGLENLPKFSDKKNVQIHWFNTLHRLKAGQNDVWDYQWVFEIVKENGFCINPSKNMVTNIGYRGTHAYGNLNDPALNKTVWELDEIIHPEKIMVYNKIIDLIYKKGTRIKPFSINKTIRYLKYKKSQGVK